MACRLFAENLAVHPNGSVSVSLHTPQRIDRYDPISGRTTPFADLPAPGMGLAFDAGGDSLGAAHFPKDRATSGEWRRMVPFDFGPTC